MEHTNLDAAIACFLSIYPVKLKLLGWQNSNYQMRGFYLDFVHIKCDIKLQLLQRSIFVGARFKSFWLEPCYIH